MEDEKTISTAADEKEDSRLDAITAVILILTISAAAVFWVSNQ
jgi:hypothetical protein